MSLGHRRIPLAPEVAGQRYLLPFRPERLPVLRWPVVVVGAGAAGASAALAAAEAGAEVLLLRKPPAAESNTRYAQGGVAAALGPEDSAERHAADTLEVACGLAEPAAVEAVVVRAAEAIQGLERVGIRFDAAPEAGRTGHSLAREGGHAISRVLSAGGDATGRAIQDGLDVALEQERRVSKRDDLRALDLLVSDGRAVGVVVLDGRGELLAILAGHVVLATGGSGQIYRETTNPVVATGDGLAIGFRAGVALRDLEFVQFHPTTLYIAGAARVLISETLRGAGAVLVDRAGRRVMEGVHADLDLAPRDVVSRAILARMVETGDTHVYLDASSVDRVVERFPSVARMCAAFAIDIQGQPVPVRPGAHYMVGGLMTDLEGATGLPGLTACGEVASLGLHGANRLASNSLLEALVIGRASGRLAASDAKPAGYRVLHRLDDDPTERLDLEPPGDAVLEFDDMLYSLKSLMWRQAGLVRDATHLEDAELQIAFWSKVLLSRPTAAARYVDLANSLLVARLVCASGLAREESRGTHFRSDHPEPDDEHWLAHSLIERTPS